MVAPAPRGASLELGSIRIIVRKVRWVQQLSGKSTTVLKYKVHGVELPGLTAINLVLLDTLTLHSVNIVPPLTSSMPLVGECKMDGSTTRDSRKDFVALCTH